ncbi:MAG: SDR family oxidoreductase [Blastocatellia bacterium]|nr:SDR family oxidoreductase [Blastocatellia bacterium]
MSKTVLITGASTGIGKAAAIYFQEKGWNVAATMRTPAKEASLAQLPNVACLQLDVLEPVSIQRALAQTIERFGRIDVLVNNAGYGLVGAFEASTPEQIRKQYDTNVFGLMEVTRAILPHFRENKGGVLINVASMGGRVTFPLYSLYHGTKWAVEGFSESLQYELRPHNIRVKIIEPGAIKTDFYERSMDIMKKPGLTAYDGFSNRALPNMMRAGTTGDSPNYVAKVIYRAATDGSWKLRYTAGGGSGMILLLRRLTPDWLFHAIVRGQVLR